MRPRSIGGGDGQVRACRHALGPLWRSDCIVAFADCVVFGTEHRACRRALRPVWRSDCIVAFADCVVFSAQSKVSLASVLGRADASLDALLNSVQA